MVEIRKNSVVYIKDENECEVAADSVILAEGIEADRKLLEKFSETFNPEIQSSQKSWWDKIIGSFE